MPALGSEIGEWRRLYNEVARRWASGTRSTVIQLPELRGLGEGAAATAASAGSALLGPGGTLFWLAVIGGGVYLLTRAEKASAKG